MEKAKILVVEDELIIGNYICKLLNIAGYSALGPEISFSDAVTVFDKEHPDLIIADVFLVGKKDGIDFAHYACSKTNIPIIFLTSCSEKKVIEKAKNICPAAFLVKPFNRNTLYASIDIALSNFSKRNDNSLNEIYQVKDCLLYKNKETYYKIYLKDILFVKSDHVYNEIFTDKGMACLIRGSLSGFIKQFPGYFIQVHKSIIINYHHIDSLEEGGVHIGDHFLPLSPFYRKKVLDLFYKL